MIRAFLFDLDGVLTDTAEYHYQAWKRLADEIGVPFSREDNEALRGVSREASLDLLLKGRSYPQAERQVWMAKKNQYYRETVMRMTPNDLLPGAYRLLCEIKSSGLKTALVSASKNARDVVARLEILPLLDLIADGSSVSRQKPAPDLFLFAAKSLGFIPGECLVVEDAAAGIEAALAGGFPCIGLGPAERVKKATLVMSSLAETSLNEILAKLA